MIGSLYCESGSTGISGEQCQDTHKQIYGRYSNWSRTRSGGQSIAGHESLPQNGSTVMKRACVNLNRYWEVSRFGSWKLEAASCPVRRRPAWLVRSSCPLLPWHGSLDLDMKAELIPSVENTLGDEFFHTRKSPHSEYQTFERRCEIHGEREPATHFIWHVGLPLLEPTLALATTTHDILNACNCESGPIQSRILV
jgi:hypothetical protein